MYHFSVTYEKGLALDPVKYFADAKNRDLGIVNRLRKPKVKLPFLLLKEALNSFSSQLLKILSHIFISHSDIF